MKVIEDKYQIIYLADDDKVFDYVDLSSHTYSDKEGNQFVEHLYVKEIVIDKIDAFVEVDEKM